MPAFLYSVIFIGTTLILILGLLGVVVLLQVYWKSFTRESSSPFECGFDPQSESRSFLFMHFFQVAVLFVIFDLELGVLLPLVVGHPHEQVWSLIWGLVFAILFFGLLWEEGLNSLDWKD